MKFPVVLILSASLASPTLADPYRLRIYGPAYGSRWNPVPDARIIHIPDVARDFRRLERPPQPLYQCERPDCSFRLR